MSKLDDIVSHIGSPWGEGATYGHDQDTSHLDELDQTLLKQDIKRLMLDTLAQAFNEGGDIVEKTNAFIKIVNEL